MDLSVIIVTWNSEKHIAKCLKSVEEGVHGIQTEVIVVDNGSEDGTVEFLDHLAGARLIALLQVVKNRENLGFARSCNIGLKIAQGEYVCFLNPDTEAARESLCRMVDFLKRHEHAGIVGGLLLNPGGSVQPSVRRFPSPWIAYSLALKLHHLPILKKLFKRYYGEGFDYSRAQKVEQVMGALFTARRTFLNEVKGFDERYFIWFEEVDLMREARRRGWEVWFYPEATAIHHGAQSFEQVESPLNQRRFLESMRKYVKKWYGWWAALPLIVLSPFIGVLYKLFFRINLKYGERK